MKDLVTIDDDGRRENHGVIEAKRQVGRVTLYLLRDEHGKVIAWKPPGKGMRKMWFIRNPADARPAFEELSEEDLQRDYHPR